VFEGQQKLENTFTRTILFDEDKVLEGNLEDLFLQWKQGQSKLWVDIRGIHDSVYMERIGNMFGIDALALEDIQETRQRTKIDLYDHSIFVIIQNSSYTIGLEKPYQEQIALFATDRVLISFQEDEEDSFPMIKKRMEPTHSRMRSKNIDYLLYAMLDYQIDKHFVIMDELNEELNSLEDRIHEEELGSITRTTFRLRSILLQLRKNIYPLRDDLSKLLRAESLLVDEKNLKYIRDLEDHTIQIIEIIDNQRELINGLKDLAVNQTSLILNKDMKWLAAVSTISIPILFLTGVYGMNFEFMPELKWKFGYPLWWITTLCIISFLVYYFRNKKMI
jgi:magnesium transporter